MFFHSQSATGGVKQYGQTVTVYTIPYFLAGNGSSYEEVTNIAGDHDSVSRSGTSHYPSLLKS